MSWPLARRHILRRDVGVHATPWGLHCTVQPHWQAPAQAAKSAQLTIQVEDEACSGDLCGAYVRERRLRREGGRDGIAVSSAAPWRAGAWKQPQERSALRAAACGMLRTSTPVMGPPPLADVVHLPLPPTTPRLVLKAPPANSPIAWPVGRNSVSVVPPMPVLASSVSASPASASAVSYQKVP